MKVFVKSENGNWLMPTSPPKARHLLKNGRARVIKRTPFTIQLTYDTTDHVQPIIVGIDDGGKKVGIAAVTGDKTLYMEEVTLRDDIKSLLDTRRSYRRSRRNKLRYRKARFINRKKGKGWIPPSIKIKKDAIVNAVKRLPLPSPTIIRLEDCYFDTQAMDNPKITGVEYQHGAQLYAKNYKQAAKIRDGFKCRVCDCSENLEVHHLKYKSKGGTDKLSNLMTLCAFHHNEHHQNGLVLPKQKSISYRSTAHVQQGKNYLQDSLRKIAPLTLTFGYITAHNRNAVAMEKSHCNDAVIIANPEAWNLPYFFKTKLERNRKRSLHEATIRKGRKQPNRTQKRNSKNTYQLKGFKRWDCVKVFGKVGFISGFSGTGSCYIKDIEGNYITIPNKSYKQVSLSKIKKLHETRGLLQSLAA